jgi:hypothetical protein
MGRSAKRGEAEAMRGIRWIAVLVVVMLGVACWVSAPPAEGRPPRAAAEGDAGIPARDELERMMLHNNGVPADIHQKLVAQLTDQQVVEGMKRGIDALLARVGDMAAGANVMHEVTKSVGGRNVKMRVGNEDLQGRLAISMYALLFMYRLTGDERLHFTSPQMAAPVKALCEMETMHTYTLAMQASALALLPNKPEFRTPLKRVRDLLVRGSRNRGNYHYFTPDLAAREFGPDDFDNSNSQYGLLGVWAADDAGLEVENAFWKACDLHWRRVQQPDGGWTYELPTRLMSGGADNNGKRDRSTTSMTAAGIASLYVTTGQMDNTVRMDPVVDPAITSGIKWITKDFETTRLKMGTLLYTAYGLERVGLASGLKYFGKYNWYREGAASILAVQQDSGLWHENWGGEIPGTCYALLFLARGRSPVVFSKLSYNGPWNARPRDVANLNRWLIKRTEQNVNWQVVDLDNSEPDDWLDGPVLVITGHGDPKFSKEEIAKLQRFTEAGGLIFSSADGADATFTDLIKKKYAPAICGNQYEMRVLPKEHPVYSMDYRMEPAKNPGLIGLSNGVREMWIHSPVDMGAAWQRYGIAKPELFEIPTNIYLYASGRASLRSKLDSLAIDPPKNAPTKALAVGRLKYAGNFDPEPAAWPRLAKIAAMDHDTAITLTPVTAEEADPAKTPVIHMTGTAAFTLGDPQAAALRGYLEKGGFLIVDSTGGSEVFNTSAKAALEKILPGNAGEEVDAGSHAVTTGSVAGGEAIKGLELRKYCSFPGIKGRKAPIWEYKLKGRTVALFFEADITSGLLGTNTWGIFGYAPATAESLAWNALLFATTPAAAKGP